MKNRRMRGLRTRINAQGKRVYYVYLSIGGQMQHFGSFPTMQAAQQFYKTIRADQHKLKIAKLGQLITAAALPNILLPRHIEIMNGPAIYFLECTPHGPIKIGHSANLLKRVGSLMSSNGLTTKLLGAIAGTVEDEQALHKRFEHARAHHEWFWPYSDLLQFLVGLGMEPTVIMDLAMKKKMVNVKTSCDGWMREYRQAQMHCKTNDQSAVPATALQH